jgi:hypothetical protein
MWHRTASARRNRGQSRRGVAGSRRSCRDRQWPARPRRSSHRASVPASNQAAHSACKTTNSATAAYQRRGRGVCAGWPGAASSRCRCAVRDSVPDVLRHSVAVSLPVCVPSPGLARISSRNDLRVLAARRASLAPNISVFVQRSFRGGLRAAKTLKSLRHAIKGSHVAGATSNQPSTASTVSIVQTTRSLNQKKEAISAISRAQTQSR